MKTLEIASAGVALNYASLAGALELRIPKRKLGRHDDMVSCLGLGGYTLALAKTVEECARIAHQAIDYRVTFLRFAGMA